MRGALVVALLSAIGLAAPVSAHWPAGNGADFRFEGAIPCAVACAGWIDGAFDACEAPFPPGSYVEQVTRPAPTSPDGTRVFLDVALDTTIDWDLFLCATAPPHAELARSTSGSFEMSAEPCHHDIVVKLACHEDAIVAVADGQAVILRGYNMGDFGPAIGRYGFRFV